MATSDMQFSLIFKRCKALESSTCDGFAVVTSNNECRYTAHPISYLTDCTYVSSS